MSPEDICRRMGETKTKAIFHELTTEGMKKVLHEAKIPTKRLASHTSTRKRNDDWANSLWRALVEKPLTGAAATLLFEWLTHGRRHLLAAFLGDLEVPHDRGLTDADFMQSTPPEKLVEAGKKLFETHDAQEVAAYLLFLDATNKSEVFNELDLDKRIQPQAVSTPAAG